MKLRTKAWRPVTALVAGAAAHRTVSILEPTVAPVPVRTAPDAAPGGVHGAACAACPNAARCADRRAGRSAATLAIGRAAATAAPAASEAPPPPGSSRLSIAHRDGLGFAAAARAGVRVGVDLERAGAVAGPEARYFLTAAERASGLHPSRLWALKEAAWKMLRLDRSVPFHALELRFDARRAVRAVALRGEEVAVAAELSTPVPGYVAAVMWSAA